MRRRVASLSSGRATRRLGHVGHRHIENLHNLEALPPTGFMVSRLPTKTEHASAGWTRVVAANPAHVKQRAHDSVCGTKVGVG
jgi:kynurenine formamidase